MASRRKGDQTDIIDIISPIIEGAMDKKKSAYINCISRFVHKNHTQLYDYAPIERIYFRKREIDDFFNSIGVSEKDILAIIKNLYYWNDQELAACKDPFSVCQVLIIRYFMKKKDIKNTELACLYLAFSGKFYASCHWKWFREFTPSREVMDYVVNYMLSRKFDIVVEKSLWGAIKNLTRTWVNSYSAMLLDPHVSDEEILYLIHQLYERIYAFLRNIAKPYFEAYEKKLYLNRESDNYDSDNYRVAQNNSTLASSITEKTITYMTSTAVSLARCHSAAQKGVDPQEIKAIFENILNTNKYLDELRFVINIMIVDFVKNFPNVKDITNSVEFIDYSIKPKPNTKDPDLLRSKNAIIGWLNTSSRYRSIKTPVTQNNYYRGILIYIVLTINAANKGD